MTLAMNELIPDKVRRRSKGRSMIMSCFAIDDRDWWCQSVLLSPLLFISNKLNAWIFSLKEKKSVEYMLCSRRVTKFTKYGWNDYV